jgi:hypothetical protein
MSSGPEAEDVAKSFNESELGLFLVNKLCLDLVVSSILD